ncbi:MAG: RyR domain-containing protein [Chlorobium sp.]
MQEEKKEITVVVTGDVTIDWNIAHNSNSLQEQTEWTGKAKSNMHAHYGSAALIADLIGTMVNQQKNDFRDPVKVTHPLTSEIHLLTSGTPNNPNYVNSYTIWAKYRDKEPEKTELSEPHWRVERFLGLDLPSEENAAHRSGNPAPDDPEKADIIVIDDSNLGFRNKGKHWPQAIGISDGNKKAPWIIVKMSTPVAEGDLWDHLISHFAKQLVVVLTIDDLRQSEIQVSARISWEKTAEELHWELTYNPKVNGLTKAAYCIVSFGPTGALLIPGQNESEKRAILLFDPFCMEGDWAPGKGMMIGKTSTLVTGIVRQIILDRDKPDFKQGIRSGVAAMRYLQKNGYRNESDSLTHLHFPTDGVISALKSEEYLLAEADLPVPHISSSAPSSFWTILKACSQEKLEELCENIVLDGTKNALKNVPIGKFGDLVTVDRQEIESLRSIYNLITEYCNREEERPVSIAVFGPPGSGKSFAVKQIAKVANPDKIAKETLTFNLSQFNTPHELIDAFHQIRDIGLSGKIPLVFWDEFDTSLDSKKLGWLRFFLAPMQDGEFQQGQLTHPIGRAIFVFAGGTSSTMAAFMNPPDEHEQDPDHKKKSKKEIEKEHAEAKVPDFLSRLKGFLNVLGPNQQKSEKHNDSYFIVRRAILLRSLFERLTPHLFNEKKLQITDKGILRAFLHINKYNHGARSMESIIAMSRLGNTTHFNRSYLPPEEQLGLHVDPKNFRALLHHLELEEALARLNHQLFCQYLRDQGYEWGEITDETTNPKRHSSLVEYDNLPLHEKEQNLGTVRDIPKKLKAFSYAMVPRQNNEPEFIFPPDILEAMAIREHERWMEEKRKDGWGYDAKTNKEKKLHALLTPWENLSEKEKDKDLHIIINMSLLLAEAGYTIVKLSH